MLFELSFINFDIRVPLFDHQMDQLHESHPKVIEVDQQIISILLIVQLIVYFATPEEYSYQRV